MEVVQQWHQGGHIVFPSWAAGAFDGYGDPRFIFYPPVSWLLGAGLGGVLPWKIVPGAFLFLTLTLAGTSMHRLARSWMSAEAALAAAVIYMAAPYQLVDLYVRSAFAELLAGAFLPLALLCVLNCARGEQMDAEQHDRAGSRNSISRSIGLRNIALLSIVYAAIWLTNGPVAVVTSYAIAFLLVILAFRRRSLSPLLQGAAGIALGLILAAAYIVPAIFEQRWVNIGEAISEPLIYSNSFVFQWITGPRHHAFSFMITMVAAIEMAILFSAAVILLRRSGKIETAWGALAALAVLSIAMMIPLTGSVLQYLPQMRFLQFPWRWMIVLGISFSAFLGGAIARARRRLAIGLIYLVFLAGTGAVLCKYFTAWDLDSTDVEHELASIQNAKGYDGVMEYHTSFGDVADLPVSAPLIELLPEGTEQISSARRESKHGTVSIESWLARQKVFTVTSSSPVVAVLHLFDYPAWRVQVNGQPASIAADPDTGQIMLALPAGTSRVEIHFGWTRDRTAGFAISGAGILILAYISSLGWRKSPGLAQ